MRKKLLALLLAAAMALSLLAGCGGGKSVAQALLKLLEGKYQNVSVEMDPELEADLRQVLSENENDDLAAIRAALEKLVGSTVTFRYLGEGQQGDTAFDLVFYAGTDIDKASQAAYSQWSSTFSTLPDDGKYTAALAMVQAENGCFALVKATVDKAGTVDKPEPEPEPEPEGTSVIMPSSIDDLKQQLADNPTATTVDFSGINGVLTIPSNVLGSAASNIEKVIIPAGTTVDESAFSGVSGLTIEVTAPDTGTGTVNKSILGGASGVTLDLSKSGLTTIDNDAFNGCTGLTSVTFPESLTGIDGYAFYGCTGLASVTFPEGLTTIGWSAFLNCDSLTSVTFPEGLTTIEMGAFQDCDKLTSVTFPKSLTTIGLTAFYNCDNLRQVTLPNRNGTLDIQNGAFSMDISSQTQPLYLRIPNADITLNLGTNAFSKRVVTLYCANQNPQALENLTSAGVKGTGSNGAIEVKDYDAFHNN